MGEEKWLVPKLHEGAVSKLGQKGNEGLARPGKARTGFPDWKANSQVGETKEI